MQKNIVELFVERIWSTIKPFVFISKELNFASHHFKPIGLIASERAELKDDYWGDVFSKLYLNEKITSKSINQLPMYVYVLFYMDLVKDEKITTSARHPRNNRALPLTGILGQRAKNRPNKIGLSPAKLVRIDQDSLIFQGLDAIDGTPVLDIFPYSFATEPKNVIEPRWISDIMSQYYTSANSTKKQGDDVERFSSLLPPKNRLDNNLIKLAPIGEVQSVNNRSLQQVIRLDPSVLDITASQGLDQFSHLQVIAKNKLINTDKKLPTIGLFSSKSVGQSALAVSTLKLIAVDADKIILESSEDVGLARGDAVYDIKPYTTKFSPASFLS